MPFAGSRLVDLALSHGENNHPGCNTRMIILSETLMHAQRRAREVTRLLEPQMALCYVQTNYKDVRYGIIVGSARRLEYSGNKP